MPSLHSTCYDYRIHCQARACPPSLRRREMSFFIAFLFYFVLSYNVPRKVIVQAARPGRPRTYRYAKAESPRVWCLNAACFFSRGG